MDESKAGLYIVAVVGLVAVVAMVVMITGVTVSNTEDVAGKVYMTEVDGDDISCKSGSDSRCYPLKWVGSSCDYDKWHTDRGISGKCILRTGSTTQCECGYPD